MYVKKYCRKRLLSLILSFALIGSMTGNSYMVTQAAVMPQKEISTGTIPEETEPETDTGVLPEETETEAETIPEESETETETIPEESETEIETETQPEESKPEIATLPVESESEKETLPEESTVDLGEILEIEEDILTLPWEDDFDSRTEDDELADWQGDYPDMSKKIVDAGNDHGMVFQIKANQRLSGSKLYRQYFEEHDAGILRISFDFLAKQKTGAASYVCIGNDDGNRVQFQIHNNGTLILNKGGSDVPIILPSYDVNKWYSVRIDMDLDNPKTTIYINDEKKLENKGFMGSGTMNRLQVGIATGSAMNSQFQFDNFILKEVVPEDAEEVELSEESISMRAGYSRKLSAKILPEDAAGEIVWSSADEAIATVDKNGKVTAQAEGTTEIIAAVKGTEIMAACQVEVLPALALPWEEDFEGSLVDEQPENWTFSGNKQTDFKVTEAQEGQVLFMNTNGSLTGESYLGTELPLLTSGRTMITAELKPYQNTGMVQMFLQRSNGDNVIGVRLNNKGKVELLNGGTASVIEAYEAKQPVTLGFLIDLNYKTADVYVNGTSTGIVPITASDIGVLQLGAGSGASSRAEFDNISVFHTTEDLVSIELDRKTMNLRTGDAMKLDYKINPETSFDAPVTFTSDNEAVATVSKDGTVTAVGEGTAKIKVSSAVQEEISAECTILVHDYSIEHIFYVDPAGDDDNAGTREEPFQTIEKAQEAVEEISQTMKGDIIVFLRGGTYVMDGPLEFDDSSSGKNGYSIVYKAYGDEEPVISGGMEITGWQPLNDGSGIYYATADQDVVTRQLYVDGERARRARNEIGAGLAGATQNTEGYFTTNTAMANWKNQSNIELVYKSLWTSPRCPVEKIEMRNNKAFLTMQQPGYYYCTNKGGSSAKNPWYIENAYELLDEPGEWYLDQTGDIGIAKNTFYYIPEDGQNMEEVEVTVPVQETLVDIQGELGSPVQNIRFEGISFQYATWLRPGTELGHPDAQNNIIRQKDPDLLQADEYIVPGAFNMSYTVGVQFEGCEFTRLGAAGLVGNVGCADTVIENCEFTDISGNGVHFGEVNLNYKDYYNPSDERLMIKNTKIYNNTFSKIGVEYRSSSAIGAAYPVNIDISHNEIHDIAYTGIGVGWGWTNLPVYATRGVKIQDNHIYNLMKDLPDGGAIYTLGYTSGSLTDRNLIKGNYIHDQKLPYGLIYLDEGSDYYEVTENVVSETSGAGNIYWYLHKDPRNLTYNNFTDTHKESLYGFPIGENTYVENGSWPEEAQAIMANAGTVEVKEDVSTEPLKLLLAEADVMESGEGELWEVFTAAREAAYSVAEAESCKPWELHETWYELRTAMDAVRDQEQPVIHPESISLDKTSAELKIGEEFILTATVDPEDATNKEVVWNSSDFATAYVNSAGKVTAKAAGSVVITATTVDGGLTADCTVNIAPDKTDEPDDGDSGHGGSSGGSNSNSSSKKRKALNRPTVPQTGGTFVADASNPDHWTYIKADGTPAKDEWVGDGKDWYFINSDGKLGFGWYLDKAGKWYLLNDSHDGTFGAVKYGWQQMAKDGKWYYLSEVSGALYVNGQTPDGYRVDENGAWIQ